jgi:hypothetical protein
MSAPRIRALAAFSISFAAVSANAYTYTFQAYTELISKTAVSFVYETPNALTADTLVLPSQLKSLQTSFVPGWNEANLRLESVQFFVSDANNGYRHEVLLTVANDWKNGYGTGHQYAYFSYAPLTFNKPGSYTGMFEDERHWSSLTVSPVPEPASLAAFGFGAVAMLRRRRRA